MQTKLNIKLIDKKIKERKYKNRSGFAKHLGISRALLCYYIKHPTLKSIEIIASGLRVKPKDLIL